MTAPLKKTTINEDTTVYVASAYRQLTEALRKVDDLKAFSEALDRFVRQDPHLVGTLRLESADDVLRSDAADAIFEKGKVVVPLRQAKGAGFMRMERRRDGRAFGAEDLQLMGAMAGLMSGLWAQAQRQASLKTRAAVLQFLADQLPLGVLCFDGDGTLIVSNAQARALAGIEADTTQAEQSAFFADLRSGLDRGEEVHLEVDGRLIFVVRRSFELTSEKMVTTCVLYDMSQRREKLVDGFDREYYRARCLDSGVVLALLRSSSGAGRMYRHFKDFGSRLELSAELIQPFDAYTCAFVFPSRSIREVRQILRAEAASLPATNVALALVSAESPEAGSPSAATFAEAQARFAPLDAALQPRLLVLDGYAPVYETLEMILEGMIRLEFCSSVPEACERIGDGIFDGIVFDLDSFDGRGVASILAAAGAQSGFRVFFSSVRRRHMLGAVAGIGAQDIVLHKPFDAAAITEAIRLAFDLT